LEAFSNLNERSTCILFLGCRQTVGKNDLSHTYRFRVRFGTHYLGQVMSHTLQTSVALTLVTHVRDANLFLSFCVSVLN